MGRMPTRSFLVHTLRAAMYLHSSFTMDKGMYRLIYLPSLHQVKEPRREGGKQTLFHSTVRFPLHHPHLNEEQSEYEGIQFM